MSHVTKRKSSIKDIEILKKACTRTNSEYQGLGTAKTWSRQDISGHLVQLRGWRYPIAIQPETGQIEADNYGGKWGKQERLDELQQGYAVEAVKAKAESEGHVVEEYALAGGGIKCVIPISVGGYSAGEGDDTSGDGYGV